MRNVAATLLALSALLMHGCSALPPVHAYEGPPRPSSEIARVTAVSRHARAMGAGGDRLYIAFVDEQPTYDPYALISATAPDTVFVLPGEHEFGIEWVSGQQVLRGTLRFTTVAGHSYLILQSTEGEQLKLWPEDVTQGQRVAGVSARLVPDRVASALPSRQARDR